MIPVYEEREGDIVLKVEKSKLTTRVNIYEQGRCKYNYIGTIYLPADADIQFERTSERGSFYTFNHLSLVVNGNRLFGTVSMTQKEEEEDV